MALVLLLLINLEWWEMPTKKEVMGFDYGVCHYRWDC